MNPLLCILACASLAPFALTADAAVRDHVAPDIALPDLPIYRALPELAEQCGIPHAILVYGEFSDGIMANPGLWIPAFTHGHGRLGALLDDWCKDRHFAWEEDPASGVITIHPADQGQPGAIRALLDQPLLAAAALETLSHAIDTDRLEKACGLPVQVEIDGANRMMRSGFAYASRSSTRGKPHNPPVVTGTVRTAFTAEAVGTPGLHWQLWDERFGTPPEITISALPVITRMERTTFPLAQVLANLDPANPDLAGYAHTLTRIDDAALELYRRVVVARDVTTAELDRRAYLAGLVGTSGERTGAAQAVVKELIGFGDVQLTTELCAAFDRLPADARVHWYEHALPWPIGSGMASDRSLIALWTRLLADRDADLRGYAKLVLKDAGKP